jgi:hypothetical protein
MVSELFRELYAQAVRRQHPLLVTAQAIYTGTAREGNLLAIGRAAAGVVEAAQAFDLQLLQAAQRGKMRQLPGEFICEICGQPHCPEALPAIRVALPLGVSPQDYLQHLLAGGDPLHFET